MMKASIWNRAMTFALGVAGLLVVSILVAVFTRFQVDYCFLCGAKRESGTFGTKIISRPVSLRVERILGYPCQHPSWRLDFRNKWGLHADAFAEQHIPLLSYNLTSGELLDWIETLPDPDWRRRAMLAVGDHDNRLKWLAVVALYEWGNWENGRIDPDQPRAELKQRLWWYRHEKYFTPESDPARALQVAREFRELHDAEPHYHTAWEMFCDYIAVDIDANICDEPPSLPAQ